MMNTVNSDQIVAVGNPVVDFLVPVVLIRGCFTGVCLESTHMATVEIKPKTQFPFSERGEIYPF